MKPRRLMYKALKNIRNITAGEHVKLAEIADVVEKPIDVLQTYGHSAALRQIEGLDIRAVEGTVIPREPARAWKIAERKSKQVYKLKYQDIIVGLVRPERRNIGLLLTKGDDLIGAPDGVAVVRIKDEYKALFPQEWLYATLRSEACRLQLWTESGGTSYGKLTREHILNLQLPIQTDIERQDIAVGVSKWAAEIESSFSAWVLIGTDGDRKPIINSATFGLVEADEEDFEDAEE